MAEANGHRDNTSRLDPLEAIWEHTWEHILHEHEMFREEHKNLVDRNSREYHERLSRLEGSR